MLNKMGYYKYLNAVKEFRLLEAKENKTLFTISVLRLFFFIGGLILIWFGFARSIPVGIAITVIVTASFLYLLKLYSTHSFRKVMFSNHVVINQN